MKRNSTSSMGAFHPIVFFMVVYGISLFLALFVCRTVYYSLNNVKSADNSITLQASMATDASSTTALR